MTPDPARKETAATPPIRLKITPEARAALTQALAGRPTGSGIRVWVERGMRPHAQMMIDHPSVRDVPVDVDGLPMLFDESSLKFLLDAEIRYYAEPGRTGFEVVGPFLPSATAPPTPSTPAAPPSAGEKAAAPEGRGPARPDVEERIRESLKNIYDPEIPMNIIDLGLIYGMDWDASGGLTIRMTMTSPGCPAVEELTQEVARTARQASGIEKVQVEVVWEPPWGPDKMTDFARRQFGYA
ncbi:MAG TPA: metal-sulfur cluster assembly factor [Thermoplasmata archaeon]|nr:metal-sulfur cluster assembly factor [Thermoplasmata archaeon]